MERDEFIERVKSRAALSSGNDAVNATRATLETLAERLGGNDPYNAAIQLPKGIAEYLHHDWETWSGQDDRVSVDEFFDRVSEREGVDRSEAVRHARAVIQVLEEAISPGEMNDIRAQLPEEYDALFEADIQNVGQGA
ncbi:MAG TPA: DUF2267 domain-containing protein [Cyanobacteria bacterium UBA8803]|nr:DUF2267 domain-containing protein [Cyanobacteria bacterium UBA9273]HBL57828.1 DUF2267 domain-containing protein [Cyanobacteria bacterium UBA8803]